jgi:hypothetical protein
MPFVLRNVAIRTLAVLALLLAATMVSAQTVSPSPVPARPEVLSDYNFHLGMSKLSIDDQRFSFDAHYGGDIDLVDYVAGRINFLADYETVLGSEYRPFDPNQANYVLEGSMSARVRKTEFAAVFHHVSRHLSDRPKRLGVGWNIAGIRALRQFEAGGWTIDGQAFAGTVLKRYFADYTWTGNVDLQCRRPVRDRMGAFIHVSGQLFGVDPTVLQRNAQADGFIEGGLRLEGTAGAVELFVGLERRMDAYPIDREAKHWVMAGFRLVNLRK